MKKLVAVSIAAFASLFVSTHFAASAINARDVRIQHETPIMGEGWNDRTKMAQATPTVWYIQGIVTINGETTHTQFIVPDNGQPALLVFDSKEKCDDARANDPDIAGPLAAFNEAVTSQGGTVVVTCEPFVHPPKGETL